jgi:assimilatory nitrate reductase catalytic subunit
VDGIESGAIRGLWIIATNTSHSWIHQGRFNELAKKLEFLVVQDLYTTTETAQRADLILPAAGWGEKDGTLINSERRIGLVRKVLRAPGEALSDFNIFKLIAAAWGCSERFREWSSPEAVFQILKRLSAGQPCDITGIRDYRHLDEAGGIQWPLPERQNEEGRTKKTNPDSDASASAFSILPSAFRERRLFADGRFYTPDQRARFLFDLPRPVAEPTDAEFPFVLLTGRGTSAQWHTNTRTGKSAILRKLYPADCYVEIHPDDAGRLGIAPHSPVTVSSRRARLTATAFVTPTVQPGQLFIPMHYDAVNRLTFGSFDPHSRQPSYKHCAVNLTPQ